MKKIKYPLVQYPYSKKDINEGRKVLSAGKMITMNKITQKFEKKFSKYLGVKYSLMVNSGSSANLLALFCIINPMFKKKVKKGDECIIPVICWSTSLWPIVQAGLKPKFVDVDLKTFNIDLEDLKKKITKKTKAVLAVHVLGNSTNMNELKKIINKKRLILVEDTCESLGSKYANKKLGSFGRFGTFSFFVSHQISAGEGGMIVCNDYEDYKIIHSLRAHGWDRGLNTSKKNNFNFINSGFNLRPTDITAAIGLNQFKRLIKMINNRSTNRRKIIQSIKSSKNWRNQIEFLNPTKKVTPSWFGLPILINKTFLKRKQKFLNHLNKQGIETRPIISGNFLNQPVSRLYNLNKNKEKFKNADEIEKRGFFIGLHANKIDQNSVKLLTKNLLMIDRL
mgnify:CR=1 FL=1